MVYPSTQVVANSDMVRYHRAEQLDEFMDDEKTTIDIILTYSI